MFTKEVEHIFEDLQFLYVIELAKASAGNIHMDM